jgi:hypothetical protein
MFMDAFQFYKKNKDIIWNLPPIPDNLKTNYQVANWILNELDFGWIKLDIKINLDLWKNEAYQSQHLLVPHRENESRRWNSACIHGIGVTSTGAWTNYGYTDELQVPYHWTELSHSTKEIKRFFTEIFPSNNYRRIRFMEVEAGGYITPHSDLPGRLPGENNFNALQFGVPVNIAVIHPKNCHMVIDDRGVVPFNEGDVFIINIRRYHSVINFSSSSRIHVIGHSFGYDNKIDDFVDLIVRSYKKEYEHYKI